MERMDTPQEKKMMLEPIVLTLSFGMVLLLCILIGISVWRDVWGKERKN
jgi:hypothetical protein